MPGFVGQRLDGLGVVDVTADGHRPGAVVGEPVGSADLRRGGAPGDGEPAGGDHLGQRIPQPRWRVALKQLRGRWGGDRVSVGLRHVEHPRPPEPDDRPTAPPRPGGGRVRCWGGAHQVVAVDGAVRVGAGSAGDRGQDPDGLLPLADLAAHRLPGPVPGDHAGLRLLHRDQDLVVERVGVQPAGDGQPVGPRLPVADRRHAGGELLVQRLEPVGAGLVCGGPLLRCAFPPPGPTARHRRGP